MRRARVARPCTLPDVRFEERDDGTRFCLRCSEVTHDLRDATRSEARRLFRQSGGKLCATVRVGVDGEIRFRPEPPSRSLSFLGGAALVLAVAGCDGEGEPATAPSSVTTSPATSPSPTAAAPSGTGAAPRDEAPPEPPADVDHATDASPDPDDHRDHAHEHAPVVHEEGVLTGALDGL